MTMTLAERLREKATWLDDAKDNEIYATVSEDVSSAVARELRALADYVEGRVLVAPALREPTIQYALLKPWYAWLDQTLSQGGNSTAEATVALQARIDKRDGRTMP
jgi:hypothetical protein